MNNNIAKETKIISTDILIIGGGIGGLAAAIRAKELSSEIDILLVDKQTIGWGGKANKGAGILWLLTPDDDIETFMDFHINNIGFFLNDQELLHKMAKGSYGAVKKLFEWGVSVAMTPEGEPEIAKMSPFWSIAAADLDMMRPLRKKAAGLGVKMMDKTQIVELLKQDDRVSGALGFNLINGESVAFKAKATVLANGDCDWGVMRMWANAWGDGVIAAYNAGAEMRNAEFANFYDVTNKATSIPFVFGFNNLYNAEGEQISRKYISGPQPDIPISIILGMEKEVLEGRGPIYIDMEEIEKMHSEGNLFKWDRPHSDALFGIEHEKIMKYGPTPSKRVEVSLGFTGEFSAIRVDQDMKTTVPGLWAVGDTSYAGSSWAGATEAPPGRLRGSGLMNAVIGAIISGPSLIDYTSKADMPEIDKDELDRLKKSIYEPLSRKEGYSPRDVIRDIQEVVVPVKYNMRRSNDRLEEALSKIAKVKERLHELYAKDMHGLGKCHEARCAVICAELAFRAALERTESRGWHYREDYPDTNDGNWLKWIILKKDGDKIMVNTEPVPVSGYKFKPGQPTFKDAVVEHEELIGVTPEMIDWWWVNMEKGYPLWEPNDHKSFVWEVPPPVGGYLGAIQIAEEAMGEMPPMKIRIRWDDPRECPIARIYEHAIVASGLTPEGDIGAMILHEWEASPKGSRMRSTMRFFGPVPPEVPEVWKKHDRSEVSMFPKFLPDLYRLWQSVKDPAINRQCSLKVGE